jgi:HEAT repeat protein
MNGVTLGTPVLRSYSHRAITQNLVGRPAQPSSSNQPLFAGDDKSGKRTLSRALPLAFLATSMLSPVFTTPARAEVTPESGRLVKQLESNDNELLAAAVRNAGEINERDAIPHIKRILRDANASEYALRTSLIALGKLGAKGTPPERADFTKSILPYMLKVVIAEKGPDHGLDKNARFVSPEEAEDIINTRTDKIFVVKDARKAAAEALGLTLDAPTRKQLVDASRETTLAMPNRLMALDALRNSPPDDQMTKDMRAFLETLKVEEQPELVAATMGVLIRHNDKDAWPIIEKIMTPKIPPKAATMAPATVTPPVAAQPKEPITGPQTDVDTKMFSISFGPSVPPESYPTKAHQSVIHHVLDNRRPEGLLLIQRQMAQYPLYFLNDGKTFAKAVKFFNAMSPEVQEGMLQNINVREAEKQVKAAFPRPASFSNKTEEKAFDDKIQPKPAELRKLSLSLASSMQIAKAGPIFQEIYTNKIQSNSAENQALRRIAMMGSALLKDESAIKHMLSIATDSAEDVDTRYDAIMSIHDIISPPLAPDLKTNTNRINTLQSYASIYSTNPKLTQSIYKSQLFAEIRDARKALIKLNAPVSAVDEATKRIVDRTVKQLGMSSQKWQALAQTPAFKENQQAMVDYVTKQHDADGFLRIAIISTLGSANNQEIQPTLKDLVHDPLARTDIPDLVSSNDMFMFPGYTKSEVAASTRLASIQALGQSGAIDATDLMEKGLRSDNRRIHYFTIQALSDIGKATRDTQDPAIQKNRTAIAARLMKKMPNVNLEGSERVNSMFKNLYAQAADRMGGGQELLKLMSDTKDTVLRRAIANALIHNADEKNNYMTETRVAAYLLSTSLGLDELHKKGIDGRGTEVAIIDGDYINSDMEAVKGRIFYPEWGNLKDARLRESFHGETVADVIANKKYGIAPGVDKIWSYAAWDDKQFAQPGELVHETDGLLRSIDDIIAKKTSGKSKVSVVNISLGGTSALLYGDETTVKEYLQKLSARFNTGSEAGITFVLSAGNERGEDLYHHIAGTLNSLGFHKENGKLVRSKGVILVGAIDTQGTSDRSKHKPAWFTSMQDVFNTIPPHITTVGSHLPLVDRLPNGDITNDEADGTSFSAPVTSGTALLMNNAHGKSFDTKDLIKIMQETSYQLTDAQPEGPGALDITRTVLDAQKRGLQADFNNLLDRMGLFMNLQQPPQQPEVAPSISKK